jgi:hypothetical protein
MNEGPRVPAGVDTGRPTPARIYDYMLQGNNYFQVERFFAGLQPVPPFEGAEPGVTFTGLWGAEDADLADSDGSRWLYCGVARKP